MQRISPEKKEKVAWLQKAREQNAPRELGVGWKISPSILMQPKETAVLADIHAMGAIKHFLDCG